MAGVRRQSSHPTAGASPSPQFPHWWHGDSPKDSLPRKASSLGALWAPISAGMLCAHWLPSELCSCPAPHPQGWVSWCFMGRPALVQPEERAENWRFPSLQRRMPAEDEGRTTLPRVLLALPGERLRDPDTSSSLLLYYSPSCLFVGFLHLTVCLIHLIGGLLPLPARAPEPNSLLGLIY